MRKSKSGKVQKWLNELKDVDNEKFKIVELARAVTFKARPKVFERIIYGGIMFTLQKDFGGLFVSKKHVSFEFSEGCTFSDPKKLLEGAGKYRRHLKLKSVTDIEDKEVAFFVRQVMEATE